MARFRSWACFEIKSMFSAQCDKVPTQNYSYAVIKVHTLAFFIFSLGRHLYGCSSVSVKRWVGGKKQLTSIDQCSYRAFTPTGRPEKMCKERFIWAHTLNNSLKNKYKWRIFVTYTSFCNPGPLVLWKYHCNSPNSVFPSGEFSKSERQERQVFRNIQSKVRI